MQQFVLRCPPAATRRLFLRPPLPILLHSIHSLGDPQNHQQPTESQPPPHQTAPEPNKDLQFFSTTQIASPSRIHKLVSSQSDPLLAKEIFDLASRQPNFRHSYSTYYSLILKLGRSRHFSLMETLLTQLKNLHSPVTPSLFSRVIRIYGDAHLPEKALKTFHSIVEYYNCKPTSKHLNHLLTILVAHRSFLRPAFDLFRAAHKYGARQNATSYNIMMRAFCYNDELSVAYKLFDQMFKRGVMPNVESYRILMQGLCRKSQVTRAVDLLEDMLNKGFVPDTLSYTTLLNSLCRKKKLREAYKLLCRMKVKGCNPNIVHYNTVILGFSRQGRALDAVKVLDDMRANGCLPNLVSYRTLVGGLIDQRLYDDARNYMEEMMSKDFSPHFGVAHSLIRGLCNVGKLEEACALLGKFLKHGEAPHTDTWVEIIPRILLCESPGIDDGSKDMNDMMVFNHFASHFASFSACWLVAHFSVIFHMSEYGVKAKD
ncbi:hypothetical protein Dimus_006708 [Dionaea muscipula]